jgi:hypothetical protein
MFLLEISIFSLKYSYAPPRTAGAQRRHPERSEDRSGARTLP